MSYSLDFRKIMVFIINYKTRNILIIGLLRAFAFLDLEKSSQPSSLSVNLIEYFT